MRPASLSRPARRAGPTTSFLIALTFAVAARAAEPPPAADRVGEWSEVSRLEFSGLTTFTAEQVRNGLRQHAPFLLASHPAAPRAELAPALERLVRSGYLAAGFPDASVSARLDPGAARIRVTVTEGRRYRAGLVRILGASTLPVKEVTRRLTTAWPPDAVAVPALDVTGALALARTVYLNSAGQQVAKIDPIWTAEQPVDFSAPQLGRIRDRVRQVLADCGYHVAHFDVRLLPDPASGRTTLQIEILGEGAHGRLGRVTVHGLERNDPATVLRWLGLEPGRPIEPDLVARLEQQLWHSARFAAYRVVPGATPSAAGEVDFELHLTELEHGPLIDGEFSPVERAMLKFREWLLDTAAFARDDTPDFVLSSSTLGKVPPELGELELTFGRQGLLAVLRKDSAVRAAVLLSARRRMFFSAATGRKLESTRPGGTLNLFASLLPQVADDGDISGNLTFGVNWSSLAAAENGGPFKLEVVLAPAAMIHVTHEPEPPTRLVGDRLVIGDEAGGLQIDPATGRLIGTGPDAAGAAIRVESGAFARTLAEVDAAAAGVPNLFSSERSATTLLRELGAEIIAGSILTKLLPGPATPGQRARAAAAFEKLCAHQPLAALDAAWAREKPRETFSVPLEDPRAGGGGLGPIVAMLVPLAEDLLPANSWPARLLRELLLATNGSAPYIAATLEGLASSPESGPLALWMAAALLENLSSPSAHAFAQRGLERLAAADFQRDCRLLFEGNSGLAGSVSALARGLRELSPEDVDALAALFPAAAAATLRQAWSVLRERPDDSHAAALQPLLAAIWEQGLRTRVEAALRKIAGAAANAAEAERLFADGLKHFDAPPSPGADLPAGARLIRRAAELGNVKAAFHLAQLYTHGAGVDRDPAAALRWHRFAAERGIIESQLALGSAYQLGLDVTADPAEAYFWYALAATGGSKPAESLRNVARRRLSAEQVAAVEQRLKSAMSPTPAAATATPK